jgi:UDP-3-O-[3-hydroxymyristoyl] glucosamine N-acyltransferase
MIHVTEEKMNRIWEFTGETKSHFGIILKRIRKISDGELGGWIEKETQLSDNAWVADNAKIYGNAMVYGNAYVGGNACVYGNARVYGDAYVGGNACVHGNAQVYDDAKVLGSSKVLGNARVCNNAQVYGYAHIYGSARVYGYAQVGGSAKVHDYARVCGDALVDGNAKVHGDAFVSKSFLIAVLTIGGAYNCTVTPQNVDIDGKLFRHEEVRNIDFEDDVAKEMSDNDFEDLKAILLVVMNRIKRLEKEVA